VPAAPGEKSWRDGEADARTGQPASRYEHGNQPIRARKNARRLVTTMSVFDGNRNKDRNRYGAEMIFVTILI
jgi:hypothetical protein